MNILSKQTNNSLFGVNTAVNNQKTNDNKTKTSIFYINDVHGQVPKMERLVSAGEHAKYLAKEKGQDFFKLCSGDTFIGSDDKRNNVAEKFLDIAGIDAETLGNHEFDITASICGNLLKNSKAQILGMNMNFPDNNSELSKKVMRSTVVEGSNGEKYGLIGIQPPDINTRVSTQKKLEGITIDDVEQTKTELAQEVNKLRNQGLNKIILLSHGGYALEKDIATSVDGIDVILGGHSHDLISGVEEGKNLLYSPSGEPVVITQAGRDGSHYGILNLEFDKDGKITYVQNNVMDTNIYSPNMIMSKVSDSILGESPVIGTLRYVDALPKNCITEENPWADFVADAIKEKLGADIVLINSANFRGSVDKGVISERDISSIFPFNNKLSKVKLNEKDLVAALKMCAKSVSADNHKPGIIQVSGLTYSIDTLGNIKELYYIDSNNEKHIIDINNPNPNKIYTAIYDEFMLGGGDGLDMLKRPESDIIQNYDFDKDKVTIDYIKSLNQPFEVKKDNRIKIVNP